jgi:hypothetical protein
LKYNRKPEGFNRKGSVRMIFPIKDNENVEFYIYDSTRSKDVNKIINTLSRLLIKRGYEHKVKWDQMSINKLKK